MDRLKRRVLHWGMVCALLGLVLLTCRWAAIRPTSATSVPTPVPTRDPVDAALADITRRFEPRWPRRPDPVASPVNNKMLVAGFDQAPDTLFGAESQASVTAQVLVGVGHCVDSLRYEYQPTYCFDAFPTFGNGGAITRTVAIDPQQVNAQNPIVVNGMLITDTLAAERAGIRIPQTLPQLTLIFALNRNLWWEDGTPVTAADAEETFRIAKDPDLLLASRYTIDRIVAVKALNRSIVVQTYAPGYLDFDYYATFVGSDIHVIRLLPAHRYKSKPIAAIREAENEHPFSFGPYIIKEHVPSERTTLISNPYFVNQPRIGTIVFKYISGADQLLAQLESNQLDYAGSVGLTPQQTPQLAQLKASAKIRTQYVPAVGWEHIDFGMERGDGQPSFFDDVRVRQAVAYAIDRQQMIDTVLYGTSKLMHTYVPPDHPSAPQPGALNSYAFDPAKARQLLDDAGWTLGSDGSRTKNGRTFSITLYTTLRKSRQATAQMVQQALRDVGIDVRLEFVPRAEILFRSGPDGILAGRRFDLALYASITGPEPEHRMFLCEQIPTPENSYGGQNYSGYCNRTFDAVAKVALNTLGMQRKRNLDKAPEMLFNKELPALPLYQDVNIAAYNPAVSGVQLDPTSYYDLYNIQEIDINR